MKLSTANRLTTLLVLLFSAASIATFLVALDTYDDRLKAWTRHHDSTLEAARLARGSDTLTEAVRAYAATADDRYRQAYEAELNETRSRDIAIERLRALGASRGDLELIETAKRNSDALVDQERQAFAAGARGDKATAIELVYGPLYRERKAAIMEPIRQAVLDIERRNQQEVIRATSRASSAGKVALGALAANLVVVLVAFLAFYRARVMLPLGRITDHARRMMAGERGVDFTHAGDAAEIVDLGRVLDEYRNAQDQIGRQRDELRLANGEQQAIFNAATSGIVLAVDRVVVRCNRRMAEMLGYTPEELIGMAIRRWYPDEAAYERVGREMYAQIARGETHVREESFVRKDGSTFWVRISGHALDPAQPDRGLVAVLDDITVERAAADEMRRARALAEDAARTKSSFLANMSHEIRTPMNAIIGMAELAQRTELTPRQRDYLDKIQGASQHLLGVINDVLDVSKIEAGKMTVERTDFELDEVLEKVSTLVGGKAAAKGLEFLVEVAPDVPVHLVGDPLRLGQILVNYAGNSVKFTEKGEVAVHVGVERHEDGAVLLRFEVRDTGIGFSEEQRPLLFRSFEQADASTTRKFGGTGLGLAISKRLAELMGGEVGATGSPGAGSTFWFTARLGIGEARPRELLPVPDLRGLRILVADDNEHACEVLEHLLEGMGFQVRSVPSGAAAVEEAVAAAREGRPFAAVLLDWQMPGTDGLAAAAEIRASVEKAPRMMLVTAYGHDELARSARDVGIEDVLAKPVTASQLFDAMMRMLGGPIREGRRTGGRTRGSTPAALSGIAGARILLVEDNDLNQQVAAELLGQAGFDVDVAGDGAQAVEKVRSGTYDLVLMDVQMPVMDGLAATREIRNLPARTDLPVVAMTANAMAGDRERCIAAGMNDHVAKPIDPEELWAALLRWVKARPGLGVRRVWSTTPSPGARVVAGPGLATFSGIPGLDVSRGLHLSMGQEELYRSLLGRFVAGQRDFSTRLEAALAAGDWAGAERAAHTLKGVSRQIGAEELGAVAEGLELALRRRARAEEVAEARARVAPPLSALIDALASRLQAAPVAPAPAPAAAVDPVALRDACSRLARALAESDTASLSVLEENEPLLRAGLGSDLGRIADPTRAFDFPAALAALEQVASARGIVLA